MHYNYHRYYDPSLGRYITPDPIGLNGGINLYGYAIANPINSIDRLGLWTFGIDFSGTFGAGGGATGGHTYVIDSDFNIARIDHSGGGGIGGAAGSVAAQIQWTNAPTIKDIEGSSVSTGLSFLPGVSATGEWIVMRGGYQGFNAGIAGGPSTPIEVHSMWELSQVKWQMNLIDYLGNWIWEKLTTTRNPSGNECGGA